MHISRAKQLGYETVICWLETRWACWSCCYIPAQDITLLEQKRASLVDLLHKFNQHNTCFGVSFSGYQTCFPSRNNTQCLRKTRRFGHANSTHCRFVRLGLTSCFRALGVVQLCLCMWRFPSFEQKEVHSFLFPTSHSWKGEKAKILFSESPSKRKRTASLPSTDDCAQRGGCFKLLQSLCPNQVQQDAFKKEQ